MNFSAALAEGHDGGFGIERSAADQGLGVAEGRAAEADLDAVHHCADALPGLFNRADDRRLCARSLRDRGSDRMMARQCEPAGELKNVGGDIGRIRHVEIGQRQRAGLVENDVVGFGETLDGIAGIEQHASLEHRARGHRLHGGDREPERAGTGDDQHRDAGDDRIMPACARNDPAQEW